MYALFTFRAKEVLITRFSGLGWIIWKDESFLHKDLIFELHYLGSTEYSYTLNFSRPSAPILGTSRNIHILAVLGLNLVLTSPLVYSSNVQLLESWFRRLPSNRTG